MPEQATDSYILFELAGTTYGVRSREVLQIEMLDQITPVPNAAPFVEGVVFSRGQVTPAVNLRVRFGFPREPHTLRTRLVVVQNSDRAVGLIVDSAREFRTIPAEAIQPASAAVTDANQQFLSGIASLNDRLVLLLDVSSAITLIETPAAEHATPAT